MSFGSPKEIHYLKPMRYHGAPIENTCCYQLPSTVTQFIGICNHLKVLLIGQNLLLTFDINSIFKVESPCSTVAW